MKGRERVGYKHHKKSMERADHNSHMDFGRKLDSVKRCFKNCWEALRLAAILEELWL